MTKQETLYFIQVLNELIVALILDIPHGVKLNEDTDIALHEIDALREQRQNLLDSLDWS